MDTRSINKALVFLSKKRGQVGCIPSNGLENLTISSYPFAYCVNSKPSNHEGEHWVGMYIAKRGSPLEFFCSFGRPLMSYGSYFKDFVIRNKVKVYENNICIQSPFSMYCGHHVIYFLFNKMIGRSTRSFYSKFSKNLVNNDAIANHFVKKMQNKYENTKQ